MSTSNALPINYDLSSLPVLDENASLKKCLDLMSKLGKGISVLINKLKLIMKDEGDLPIHIMISEDLHIPVEGIEMNPSLVILK